jgi:replicative DNA helicase
MAVERIEPQLANVECEAALCGALMIDNRLVDAIADILSPEDFSDGMMGRIYTAILREASLGRPANVVTLQPYFADDPDMRTMGGPGWLANLTGSGIAVIGAKGFAEQIATLAARRRLIGGLSETITLASDPLSTTEELIDAADAALMDATHKGDPLHQPTGAECLDELMATFDDPVKGVECKSIPSIDALLGAMRPKQLIIGAGRPGMGKTATALSYSIGAAKAGHGVLFVSLEMSSTELGARMASDLCFNGHSGIPFECIRDGRLNELQRRQIARARSEMGDVPFRVIDAGKLSIGRLAMIVRRYKRRMAAQGHKLELVVVDYLQLLSADTKGRSNYETVSEVSRGLKAIAKDQGVAVFALAQLSREAEKRPDKKPQLSDLRDSGQIEQDADAVLFLYRAEYYLRQNQPDEKSPEYADWKIALANCENRIDFICAKRRNGRIGTQSGYFFGGNQAVRG